MVVFLGAEVCLQLAHRIALSTGLQLLDPESLKDFPVDKKPEKTDLILMRHSAAVNHIGSTVCAETWQ